MRRFVAILALSAVLLVASAAAAPGPAHKGALDRTVRYLQEAQGGDGGFGESGEPSQVTSAWTTLALAAAGVNPQDQARPGGVDAFAYLVSHYREGIEESECAPLACTTALERELMVVNASGARPEDFGGVDLVGQLLERAAADGSFPHVPGGSPGVNDTIFAIFALAPIQGAAAKASVQAAADWVEAAQRGNGGWAWSSAARDEVDMTGAAVQALIAAGRPGSAAAQEGISYLREAQNPDGGFPEFPGNSESNVASTAWAVQAIWAAGENPEAWLAGPGEEPLDYMESLQEPDGHIRWKRSQDVNGVWMTAYTTPAFAGHPWPIPAPPRSQPPATPAAPGQGGGGHSGGGVIAGGGGEGAPLFSRPKPQSRGKTPGGARVIQRNARATNRSRSRRGANAKQPTWTQSSEPTRAHPNPEPGGAGAGGSLGGGSNRGTGPSVGGREVTGTLIGSLESGELAFGAPGLDGAGAGEDETVALGIGAAALLLTLCGAQWERRRQEAIL
jgi:prenyltransferase beta subunit